MIAICEPELDMWFNLTDGTNITGLKPLTARWTLDVTWTPYGSMQVTLPLDEEIAAQIDPTAGRNTYAHLTALRNHIATAPDGPPDVEDPQQYGFTMLTRSLERNPTDGTMTVSLVTFDQAYNTDVQTDHPGPTWPAGTPVYDIVDSIVGLHPDTPALADTISEDVTWDAGVSTMDFVLSVVGPTGRKLLVDESSRVLLVTPGEPITQGPAEPRLYRMEDVLELEATQDIDGTDFADDVLVMYRWTDSSGTTQERVDVSTPSGVSRPKWVVHRPDGRYPGPGAADNLRARLARHGTERTLRMLWDLEVRPGITLAIQDTDGTVTEGTVRSVTFREDGTMDVVQEYADMRETLMNLIYETIQGGSVDITYGGDSKASVRVDFPTPYDAPPPVVACYAQGLSSPRTIATAYDVDATGFTAEIQTADGSTHTGTRTLAWIAIPPAP